MRRSFWAIVGMMAICWATQLWAQGRDPQYERVQSIILMRLSTTLGLDSSQTQQMGMILNRHHDRKRQLRREIQDLNAQLRANMAGGNSSQTQALLAKLDRTRRQLSGVNDEMYSEARRMLNPQQQAQFMLVMDEVKSEIRSVRDRPPGAGFPRGNPYTPGSPYFPVPAYQDSNPHKAWVR
jgi:hypothetical protein